MSPEVQTAPNPAPRSRFPLVKSKSFLLAVAASLIGLALWIGQKPATKPDTTSASSGVSSFAESGSSSSRPAGGSTPSQAPALFRYATSYLGGFLVGAWRGSRRG